ncbi:alpha/beta fold hydrolase [Paenibacillus sp. GSMTC-2017]|uniref:alpha/beta hydrolase n=1 Tax=Paenibacillus sp. GSMTC-2017 TaxID=2794350 RepID=UPI0018D93FA1|nr:alpha/beta hydrolase [Paenibacillus sp. GSMTC-2017]MBH5318947.1 alpha/beta fold hydrolase [Paenibacillus sp. GSMTC-2017]
MSTTLSTTHAMESLAPAVPVFPPVKLPYPTIAPLHSSKRSKHILVASLASLLSVCFIVVIIFHGYVAWSLAYPYVAPLASNPQEAIGVAYEDVIFPSHSGQTTVSGWYVPAAPTSTDQRNVETVSKRTVVFSHGYGANREEHWVPMYDLTKLLHDLNYNVLLFDYGYASQQYKAPATGGREESQQLLAAIDYAKYKGAEDVIVWGFSMGAGTALQTALVTNEIDAMILDSLFIPSSEALFDNINQFVPLPRFPSLPLIESMIPLWSGGSFGSVPAEQVIANDFSIPTFIIHGTDDVKASHNTAEAIALNQGDSLSRSWIVQDGQHEMLFRKHPQEYVQRTALFLSQVEGQLNEQRITK